MRATRCRAAAGRGPELAQSCFVAYKYQLPISLAEFLISMGPRIRPYYYLRAVHKMHAVRAAHYDMDDHELTTQRFRIGHPGGWPTTAIYDIPAVLPDSLAVDDKKLVRGAPVRWTHQPDVALPREREHTQTGFCLGRSGDTVRVRPVNLYKYNAALPPEKHEPFTVDSGPLVNLSGCTEVDVPRCNVRAFDPEQRISVHWPLLANVQLAHPSPAMPAELLIDGSPSKLPGGRPTMGFLSTLFSSGGADGEGGAAAGLVRSRVSFRVGGELVPVLLLRDQADGTAPQENALEWGSA